MQTIPKQINDCKSGDLIDLEGDIVADFNRNDSDFRNEYSEIINIKQLDKDNVLVEFKYNTVYRAEVFPSAHLVRAVVGA